MAAFPLNGYPIRWGSYPVIDVADDTATRTYDR